ncbi:MAG: NAD(P)H-hydrate dehydratase [Bauldia sp.]|nr:NAD(P)H-hydrate dehydratase [Bauldia sp.]
MTLHHLLTPDQMRQADAYAIAAGTPGIALMERAGAAVAKAARRHWRGGRIIVLAGPGMNGGDGWVAARLLRDAGFPVAVAFLGDRSKLLGDAALAAGRYQGSAEEATGASLAGAGLVIDALYGAGVRLPLPDIALDLIRAANASGTPVVAVDLPSGVDGGEGAVGDAAIVAAETVTFFRRKPGHLLLPGRGHCGAVTVADIGIPEAALASISADTFHNAPALWGDAWPVLQPETHKYRRGHAVVVSGDAMSTGAARLAAIAALRSGAGLVTVASPPDAAPVNAAQLTAVMVRPFDGAAGLADLLGDARKNAVVLGPGLGVGERTRTLVETALGGERAVVLDADALTSFAGEARRLLAAVAASKGPVVVTPHDGEFARIVPDLDHGSRLRRARAAARRSGAIVVLKGPDTVVAAPDGRAAIADNAPPTLATAGSGDVLAGMIGGLLAQGMPAFEAAAAAVWLHGEAATEVGPGLISEDLPGALPAVLARLA